MGVGKEVREVDGEEVRRKGEAVGLPVPSPSMVGEEVTLLLIVPEEDTVVE